MRKSNIVALPVAFKGCSFWSTVDESYHTPLFTTSGGSDSFHFMPPNRTADERSPLIPANSRSDDTRRRGSTYSRFTSRSSGSPTSHSTSVSTPATRTSFTAAISIDSDDDACDVSLTPPHRPLRWRINRWLGRKNLDISRRHFPVNDDAYNYTCYPDNEVNNRRYSLITFVPVALADQFRFSFFNVYFLAVAVSQFVPALRVGFIYSYFAPLAFVVALSMGKEAFDDIKRWVQDRKINAEMYERVLEDGTTEEIRSKDIRVGMLLQLQGGQRIPADLALMWTSEANGACFVRTDQLDGETDWKLRYPVKVTRELDVEELAKLKITIECEPPSKEIEKFEGRVMAEDHEPEGLNVNNALWCSCTVASGTVIAAVIYTGTDTRSSMNMERQPQKRGLTDAELNWISFLCFLLLVVFSILLVVQQYDIATLTIGQALINLTRFQILLSSIIPISMRVNLDIARLWYSFVIYRDQKAIPGVVVRNTNIPEELGRLSYLFSDKTGTLTKNQMEFRTVYLDDQFSFEHTEVGDIRSGLEVAIGSEGHRAEVHGFGKKQSNMISRAIRTLALCHNVTPARTDPGRSRSLAKSRFMTAERARSKSRSVSVALPSSNRTRKRINASSQPSKLSWDSIADSGTNDEATCSIEPEKEYEASSPDEIAMVKFAAVCGIHLRSREVVNSGDVEGQMVLDTDYGQQLRYDILKTFPFSSERKCMGIVVRDKETNHVEFLMKGADSKMISVLSNPQWVQERCNELAKAGRRTLVFAMRELSDQDWRGISDELAKAEATPGQEARDKAVEDVMKKLECNMSIVCATGVEDKLQDNVIQTLERLGACGIRVWMLTGDKVETAQCIGRSTKLLPPNCIERDLIAHDEEKLERLLSDIEKEVGDDSETKWSLLVDGSTVAIAMSEMFKSRFVTVAKLAHTVIIARCSPTQKAEVVSAVKHLTPKSIRVAAIGDGGNDVSMILAANIGIGIEGVEGKQASLAADYSITQFSHCERLITWHGRNSYKRSCALAQFIIHRGIVYAVVQAVFSVAFAGSTISVFNGYLIMLYSTLFTMAPVFALVLNEDQLESQIDLFPELYRELLQGRTMNTRTFLMWVWFSLFQGGVMMYMTLGYFSDEFFQIVSIAFTTLLITELTVVATCVHFKILWRQRRLNLWLFLLAEVLSLVMYVLAVEFLPDTFDKHFFWSWGFWWRVSLISVGSILPLVVLAFAGARLNRFVSGRPM
jgi:phospholipid-translocating ATPase